MHTNGRRLADSYLAVAEAAEQLSVHPSTVRRWIHQGLIPAYRLGQRRVGIRPSDLKKMVARKSGPDQPAISRSL